MDRDPYNGWPNQFTWLLFCHLSSDADLFETVCQVVADAPAPAVGAERLRERVQESFEEWLATGSAGWVALLSRDLLAVALGQVEWDHLAGALRQDAP